jgi:hypothetical protein
MATSNPRHQCGYGDEVAAAAVIEALTGAVNAAALASQARGDNADDAWAAMLRATEIALPHLQAATATQQR